MVNSPSSSDARRALVVGGGIAGSAAAWWLHHYGWKVVLVDAQGAPAEGGFVLDLDEVAQSTLHEMGADGIVERVSFPSPATTFRLTKGHRPLQMTFSGEKSRLVHRGRLIQELLDHVPTEVDVRLGRRLESLEHRAADVVAHFDDGSEEQFDIVIGADGVHSTVRDLIFGPGEAGLYRNGLSHVWMTLPRGMREPEALVIGRNQSVVFAYPYPDGKTTQIVAAVPAAEGPRDDGALVHRVAHSLHSMGGELAEIGTDVLRESKVLVTRFTQLRTERWHTRRVVLIGDAAHCIDPMSGLGAHGALLGAVSLARALEAYPTDTSAAFAAYEAEVRPFVESRQQVTARLIEFVTNPWMRSRLGTVLGGLRELFGMTTQIVTARGRSRLAGHIRNLPIGSLNSEGATGVTR